ncbi:MAG: Trk system potassium transporter TrkA [Lentisphaeria bacterium]|nr:Trk system potassium transporter TrkA [Lentisphaeria bacterium]
MKIIIIGAGELGQLLAERLSSARNDVTIIDISKEGFARIHEKLDVMTLAGDATSIKTMAEAGTPKADMLIAVSGDQASNILACTIAKHFGVKKTICRLYSMDAFDESLNIMPDFYGIDKAFSSPAECANSVLESLQRRIILESIQFSNHEATLVTAVITSASPLQGLHLQDIPNTELLSKIRIAALVRDRQLMIPHGDTMIYQGDKLYIAGHKEYVEQFLDYAEGHPDPKRQLIIIAGVNRVSEIIASKLLQQGHEVRFVGNNLQQSDDLLNEMPDDVMIVHGDITDEEVLKEAGIAKCDSFIGIDDTDEKNILSCILAKRLGAKKAVVVTHKPEYISILPAMDVIDSGFNTTLVSLNTIFRLMGDSSFRIDSRLLAFQAFLKEFTIKPSSALINKTLKNCKLPSSAVLAMIFRNNQVITPTGDTELKEGDVVVAIVTPASEEQIKPYFG